MDRIQQAHSLLTDYQASRDAERYALELVKSYSRRRQKAYSAYLKAFDEIAKADQLTEDDKREFDARLEQIQHSFSKKLT